MVKVLPEPVTPSSTWSRSCERTPLTNSSIACGWSPSGSNSDTTRNRRPPSDLSGRGGRCGTHGGRLRMLGSPSSKSALSELAETAAPVRPRGWLSGAGLSNLGCGASPKPRRPSARAGLSSSARCSSSGCRSGRDALDFGAGVDFRGAGMAAIWGELGAGGRPTTEHRRSGRPRLEALVACSALSETPRSPAMCRSLFFRMLIRIGRDEKTLREGSALRPRKGT